MNKIVKLAAPLLLLGLVPALPAHAAPSTQPFAVVTRTDGTTSSVGGSVGCFGTEGSFRSVDVTPGYKAAIFSDYGCRGNVLVVGAGRTGFPAPFDARSIALAPS
ncbi:hypothetical protein ACIRU3_10990 [Streptomyces sp. NPDC101151]|uniref:hypothetical protein n=1 Tax=Streptomyces sp. NPDC101151 TaxID=3366115 RepID=UPI0037FB3B12